MTKVKLYARCAFNVEQTAFKAGDLIAEIESKIPLGNVQSLLGRPDMTTTDRNVAVETDAEQNADSDEVDESSDEESDDDDAVAPVSDETKLDDVVDEEPAMWWFEANVETVGELKEWLQKDGNKLVDAPTIGKVSAKKLAAQLGLGE